MNNELIIRDANIDDINTIGFLAYQVWPVTYRDILSLDQLQYMLNLIYSPASLHRQMTQEQQHFFLAELDNEPVGFASYSPLDEPGIYKLHKLYVRTDIQGKGLGRALLDEVINTIQPVGAHALRLNVNRHNKALSFYEKLGFRVISEQMLDIGNNYFMDDYVMQKDLAPASESE